MEKVHKNLAMVLGKFSTLLVKEKIIDPEADQVALAKAITNVLRSLSESPKPQKRKKINFAKVPLASLLSKHYKTQAKIEENRQRKILEESSKLKTKPTIAKPSQRTLSKTQNLPLYQRTEIMIQAKQEKLEKLRLLSEIKEENDIKMTCTFTPNSQKNQKNRSPKTLAKQFLKWDENRKITLEKLRKDKDSQEILSLIEKPKIGKNSERLAKSVIINQKCVTPVHERLHYTKGNHPPAEVLTFIPQINPKSLSMIEKILNPKTQLSKTPPVVQRDLKNIRKGFHINTSLGNISSTISNMTKIILNQKINNDLFRP